jgi:hypothetical protein
MLPDLYEPDPLENDILLDRDNNQDVLTDVSHVESSESDDEENEEEEIDSDPLDYKGIPAETDSVGFLRTTEPERGGADYLFQ